MRRTEKPIAIYALRDPRDSTIRYIGRTVSRPVSYRVSTNPKGSPVRAWADELKALGLKPIVEVLDDGDASRDGYDGYAIESDWIVRMKEAGEPLLNKAQTDPNAPVLLIWRRSQEGK